jgi:hypothetical protein
MKPHDPNAIVADGQGQARAAAIDKARAEVEARHAPELARAGWWRRWLLRLRIRREVEQRLERTARRDGLYGRG